MSDASSAPAPGAQTTYDETPYPSSAFPQTHPNRLAAMARLFGMDAPAPGTARVLELGCADGSNLLPMAQMAPGASFLGIDASQVQIAEGLRARDVGGLKNVELRVQNILDFPASEGKFDYIIAHGVFSWVPEPVREKMLTLCSEHLTENGIAYISYNTLPGWHMRRSLRDVMLYHAGGFADPKMKVDQARAILGFMAQSVPAENNAYALLLQSEVKSLSSRPDGYLRHDMLEEENTAMYFHQFVERAGRHGLQFLSEPNLAQMMAENFSDKIRQKLVQISPNIVAQEQYMDFVKNRTFRQTLLCRRDRRLERTIAPARMKGLAFRSLLRPMGQPVNLAPDVAVTFIAGHGAKVSTSDSFLKAAMQVLVNSAAQAIEFSVLLSQARELVGDRNQDSEAQQEATLSGNFIGLLGRGFIEIFAEPVASARAVPAKPLLPPLNRHQAINSRFIVNRLHESNEADHFVRNVVELSDGQMTGEEMLAALVTRAQAGTLNVSEAGRAVEDPVRLRALLAPRVAAALNMLTQHGYFAP